MTRTRTRAVALVVALIPALAFAKTVVSTNIASYTEGDSTGYKPQKLVLLVDDAPDDTRKAVEKGLVDALGKRGIVAVPHHQIVPAAEASSPDAQQAAFKKEGIDSGLTVKV